MSGIFGGAMAVMHAATTATHGKKSGIVAVAAMMHGATRTEGLTIVAPIVVPAPNAKTSVTRATGATTGSAAATTSAAGPSGPEAPGGRRIFHGERSAGTKDDRILIEKTTAEVMMLATELRMETVVMRRLEEMSETADGTRAIETTIVNMEGHQGGHARNVSNASIGASTSDKGVPKTLGSVHIDTRSEEETLTTGTLQVTRNNINSMQGMLVAVGVPMLMPLPGKKRALPLQRPKAGLKRLRKPACRSKKGTNGCRTFQ